MKNQSLIWLCVLFAFFAFIRCKENKANNNVILTNLPTDSLEKPIPLEIEEPIKSFSWEGKYSSNFLRMKEESGDPRGWGMIYIDVNKDSSTFKLESYIEQISKELKILEQKNSEIILSLKKNRDSTFIISKKENQYFLESNFISNTVGETEIYPLKKLIQK